MKCEYCLEIASQFLGPKRNSPGYYVIESKLSHENAILNSGVCKKKMLGTQQCYLSSLFFFKLDYSASGGDFLGLLRIIWLILFSCTKSLGSRNDWFFFIFLSVIETIHSYISENQVQQTFGSRRKHCFYEPLIRIQ